MSSDFHSLLEQVRCVRTHWETGFAIVAKRLNDFLAQSKTSLRIESPEPPDGEMLHEVRRRFLNALSGLRPYLHDLPSENELLLWSSADGHQLGRWGQDIDSELEEMIKTLQSQKWREEELKTMIVHHAEESVREWGEFFNSFEEQILDRMTPDGWDKALYLRNKYIYEQWMLGTDVKTIIAKIKRHEDWETIETHSGIKGAARRFAEIAGLRPPEKRRPGRPKNKES